MHIQKLSVMICLAALIGASSMKAQGNADTEAQAKARALLRDTIDKLNAQSGLDGQLANAPHRLSPDEEAKVFAALRQAKADLDAKDREAAMARQASGELTSQQRAAAALAAKQNQESSSASRMDAANDDAAQKRAAADMAARQKQAGSVATSSGMADSAAMVPGSKEQRLADLLLLYKADKITPTEYHLQRAKIISEP